MISPRYRRNFRYWFAGVVLASFFLGSTQLSQGGPTNKASESLHKPSPTADQGALSLEDPTSLLRSLGIPRDEWGGLLPGKDLLSRVNALPPGVKTFYKSMSFFDKLKLKDKVNGTTETPLFTIENKPAFITGQVKGYDTFAYLKLTAEGLLSIGKIDEQEYEKRVKVIDVLSKLTPEERQTLIDLLEGELAARHSS